MALPVAIYRIETYPIGLRPVQARYVFISPHVQAILGVSAEELRAAWPVSALVHPNDLDAAREVVHQRIDSATRGEAHEPIEAIAT